MSELESHDGAKHAKCALLWIRTSSRTSSGKMCWQYSIIITCYDAISNRPCSIYPQIVRVGDWVRVKLDVQSTDLSRQRFSCVMHHRTKLFFDICTARLGEPTRTGYIAASVAVEIQFSPPATKPGGSPNALVTHLAPAVYMYIHVRGTAKFFEGVMHLLLEPPSVIRIENDPT